jgi:uncharacterized repeat protein (TIGR02543 family)
MSLQTVTVHGVDDLIDDAMYLLNYYITCYLRRSKLQRCRRCRCQRCEYDNDTVWHTLSATSGLTTTEAGAGTATFYNQAKFEPTADVYIEASSSDTYRRHSNTESRILPFQLVYPQTFTVHGVDDFIDDDNVLYNVVTAQPTASADAVYAALNPSDVSVTNTDNDYTVSFNPQGGSTPVPSSITVTYGSYYGDLPTVTRSGYTFNGWYTAATGGTQVTNATTVTLTANQTLYAQWTALLQTIIYNANTGTGTMAPTTGNTGASVTLSTNTFTKAGYTFGGWNTLAGGGGTTYTNGQTITMPAGGLTLYAQWTAFPPTITSVSPTAGPTAGGLLVTITGTNFQPGATVTFGGSAASVGAITTTTISATTPAHAAGAAMWQ